MEVLVGPTFTIDVASSPPPYSADRPITAAANDRPYKFSPADSSDSDSSIGTPDDSSDDDDDVNDAVSSQRNQNDHDEVHSKLKGLASLDSLEDSLPIKRGLSNHFLGKSKSFTDLSQVTTLNTAKELQKQENPFNKRRRVQIATKWTRKSSFYAWSNPQSMPLLPVHEDEDEDDDYEEEDEKPKKVSPSSSSSTTEEKKQQRLPPPRPQSYVDHMRARFGSFKSRSLSDLKEHDEEEEEDDEDDDE